MMCRLFFIYFFLFSLSFSQEIDYYESTNNLTGDDLKIVLHDLINDHVQYDYELLKKLCKRFRSS